MGSEIGHVELRQVVWLQAHQALVQGRRLAVALLQAVGNMRAQPLRCNSCVSEQALEPADAVADLLQRLAEGGQQGVISLGRMVQSTNKLPLGTGWRPEVSVSLQSARPRSRLRILQRPVDRTHRGDSV